MTERPPSIWDERYAAPVYAYGEAPNAFLVSRKSDFLSGQKVLVPADGEGRNGVWLAEQGLDVTTFDLSETGPAKSRALAEKRGVRINALTADALAWDWPEGAFDHIVLVFFHLPPDVRQQVHANVIKALAPGGQVTIEGFTPAQIKVREAGLGVGGPPDIDWLMTPEMLRTDFSALHELYLQEHETDISEGPFHTGRAAVIDAVFKKDPKS